jgi:hypothetical protein
MEILVKTAIRYMLPNDMANNCRFAFAIVMAFRKPRVP